MEIDLPISNKDSENNQDKYNLIKLLNEMSKKNIYLEE